MSRLYPFAAAVWCATSLAAFPSWSQPLAPHQQQALERVLATADPSSRPAMRAQLEPVLAAMDEAQVRLMMDAMAADAVAANPSPADEPEPGRADPADLAFNREQYEPVVRETWQAQKAFDDFIVARLATACGETYAVFGSGWRYEVYPLSPAWTRASQSADLDVEIIGASYAPQDGRYRFEFGDVRKTFDQAAVAAAVDSACAEYRAIGERFLAEARARRQGDSVPGGFDLEQAANRQVAPVRQRLEDALTDLAPAADGALFMALLNGERLQ